jgi:hypothetical protein
MAVPTINNIVTDATTGTGNPAIGLASYTPSAGDNGALIVMITIANTGTTPQIASGVTYDGNALSLVVRQHSVASGNFSGAEMWKLDDPLSLAASGAIAVNGVPDSTLVASGIAAFTLLGVKQAAADDTNTVALTSGTTIDGDVTPTDDDSLILSGVTAREQMNFAATSPHVEDIEVDPNFGSLGIGHTDVATAALTNVEWDITGSTQRKILILAAFGPAAGVTVEPNDAIHGHTAGNVTLSQVHDLVVANAIHGHTAGTITLAQVHALVIASAVHAHTAGNVTVQELVELVIDSAIHAHTAGNVTLSQSQLLAINNALHGHSAGNITLAQVHSLIVASAGHSHTAENVVLGTSAVLEIANALHAHSASNAGLTQTHILAIADALHAHAASNSRIGEFALAEFARRLYVGLERRTVVVPAEDRTVRVPPRKPTTIH